MRCVHTGTAHLGTYVGYLVLPILGPNWAVKKNLRSPALQPHITSTNLVLYIVSSRSTSRYLVIYAAYSDLILRYQGTGQSIPRQAIDGCLLLLLASAASMYVEDTICLISDFGWGTCRVRT